MGVALTSFSWHPADATLHGNDECDRHDDVKSCLKRTKNKACKNKFSIGEETLEMSAIHEKKKELKRQTRAPTPLKRTYERIKNCTRMLLDLSSPASSESVVFLSRTGAGGLETRLTEAIGNTELPPRTRVS